MRRIGARIQRLKGPRRFKGSDTHENLEKTIVSQGM